MHARSYSRIICCYMFWYFCFCACFYLFICLFVLCMYLCMHVCVRACVHACVRECIRVCMHVCFKNENFLGLLAQSMAGTAGETKRMFLNNVRHDFHTHPHNWGRDRVITCFKVEYFYFWIINLSDTFVDVGMRNDLLLRIEMHENMKTFILIKLGWEFWSNLTFLNIPYFL